MRARIKRLSRLIALAGALAALAVGAPVLAFPDGAPWDATPSMGDGEACHRCHFDYDAITESPALRLEGVTAPIQAGARYDLTLKLEAEDAAAAGFLMIARVAGEGETASLGAFEAIDEGVEANGAAIRSTTSSAADMTWRAVWTAPETLDGPVVFDVVANAANDDLSPFGDVIHLATFVIETSSAD